MTCTRCQNSGFLNLDQVPEETVKVGITAIQAWIEANQPTDAQVCDCCGDGIEWYGTLGEHFEGGDHSGNYGPYAYNGGLPECY